MTALLLKNNYFCYKKVAILLLLLLLNEIVFLCKCNIFLFTIWRRLTYRGVRERAKICNKDIDSIFQNQTFKITDNFFCYSVKFYFRLIISVKYLILTIISVQTSKSKMFYFFIILWLGFVQCI
jgi:hypothetical protein